MAIGTAIVVSVGILAAAFVAVVAIGAWMSVKQKNK